MGRKTHCGVEQCILTEAAGRQKIDHLPGLVVVCPNKKPRSAGQRARAKAKTKAEEDGEGRGEDEGEGQKAKVKTEADPAGLPSGTPPALELAAAGEASENTI